MKISFNKPYMTGMEFEYIKIAYKAGKLAGDGDFTKKCHSLLEDKIQTKKALLTHSCTAALEMTALLLNLKAGDEVIMPSYTFVSTANAFTLRGAVPVFVDIREDTLNIDENKIEEAISRKTKAICVVHYAGVSCEMDTIMALAKKYDLPVIEDAAQGIMSYYKGKPVGSIGDLACLSFHETKNVISGEGGALLVNNLNYASLSEIIREKGTDRSSFFRGEVDKYTWQEKGSSYLPGELIAAFLYAQLQKAEEITNKRLAIWNRYHILLEEQEKKGLIKRPTIPDTCVHNAHLYYIILREKNRNSLLKKLQTMSIQAVSHYVPLHSSPAGKKYGKIHNDLQNTELLANGLIRLPLFYSLSENAQDYIVESLVALL